MIFNLRLPRFPALWLTLATTLLAAAAFIPSALARSLYVTNYKSDTVSVVDGTTNQIVGPPISTGAGSGPYTIAISPDGKTAYWSTTPLEPWIGDRHRDQPDRRFADPDPGRLLRDRDNTRRHPRLRRQRQRRIGHSHRSPDETGDRHADPVCNNPYSVTISPDGTPGSVACADGVRILDVGTNQIVGSLIPLSSRRYRARSPRTGRAALRRPTRKGSVAGDRHRDQPADRRADPDGGNLPVGRDLPRRDPRLRARLRRKPDSWSSTRRPDRSSARRSAAGSSNNPNTPPSAPTGRRSSRASSRPAQLIGLETADNQP